MIRSLRSMQMNLMQMENKTRLFNATDILQKALFIAVVIALLLLLAENGVRVLSGSGCC